MKEFNRKRKIDGNESTSFKDELLQKELDIGVTDQRQIKEAGVQLRDILK